MELLFFSDYKMGVLNDGKAVDMSSVIEAAI